MIVHVTLCAQVLSEALLQLRADLMQTAQRTLEKETEREFQMQVEAKDMSRQHEMEVEGI